MSGTPKEQPVTIGVVASNIMRYWPALLAFVFLITVGAEARLQIRAHDKTIEVLERKLESKETDVAQWKLIRSLVEDTKEFDTRLKEAEKHITPAAVQKWGEIQWKVEELWTSLNTHIRNHEE